MSKYQSVFEKVGSAKAINNYFQNLPLGNHRVALVRYRPKQSQKDKTIFLEAEFIVLATDNPLVKAGTRYSWPWFINKPDEWGYTHARAKNFIEVVQRCVGNEEDMTTFGNALAEDFDSPNPRTFGLTLDVEVKQLTNASGGAARGKKGNEIHNATWIPVAQDEAAIAATAAGLSDPAQHQATGRKLGGVLSMIGKSQ